MVAALYRRYRPESFAEMVGQQQVTGPLMTALRTGRVNHAYLFSGPRGCGKTSSARILARCLNCAQGPTDTPCGVCDSCRELGRDGGGSLDVIEIDAASHGGVDDARDLRERALLAPSRDRYKIFIIDEAHMVTGAGFNALLKVVEEPPEEVLFIFATTEPEKVIGTIRSRTHHFPFRLIPPATMLELIEGITRSEGMDAEPGVLPLVVRAGGGSARDTESLLDQIMAGSEGSTMRYEMAVQLLGFTADEVLSGTIDAFADHDAAAAYTAIDGVIQSGQDPRRFVEDLLERIRDLIVVKATGAAAPRVLRGMGESEVDRLRVAADRFEPRSLSALGDTVNRTLSEMSGVTSPRVQLELMVARILVALKSRFADETPEAAAPRAQSARPRVNVTERPVTVAAPVPAATSERPAAASAPQAAVPESRAAVSETRAAQTGPVVAESVPAESAPAESAPAGRETGGDARPPERARVTIEQIRDAWDQVLDSVQRIGGRQAWLVISGGNVRPLELDGSTLRIELPNRGVSDQLRTPHGDRPMPGTVLKHALTEVLGERLTIQPRVRLGGEALASAGPAVAGDEEHHRGSRVADAGAASPARAAPNSTAPNSTPPRTPPRAGSRESTGGPSTGGPSTGGPTWTVARIPGDGVAPDDGPGSAWDEHASTTGADPADAVSADSPAPDAGPVSPGAAAPVAVAPDAARSASAKSAPAGAGQAGAGQAGAGPAESESAQSASAQPVPETPGSAPVRRAPELIAAREARAREAASAPEAMPEPPEVTFAPPSTRDAHAERASSPRPIPAAHSEPEVHPALGAGSVRYGESVVRELLGARFVAEEPIEQIVPAEADPFLGQAPDESEPPPEEY